MYAAVLSSCYSVDDLGPSVAAEGSTELVQDGSIATEDEVGSNVLGVEVVSWLAAGLTVDRRREGQLELGAEEREEGRTHEEM